MIRRDFLDWLRPVVAVACLQGHIEALGWDEMKPMPVDADTIEAAYLDSNADLSEGLLTGRLPVNIEVVKLKQYALELSPVVYRASFVGAPITRNLFWRPQDAASRLRGDVDAA